MNTTTMQPASTSNGYQSVKSAAKKAVPSSSVDSEKSGIQSMFDSLDADETLQQLKGYVKVAADFAKKRPVLVLSVACAIGAIGMWAWTSQKSIPEPSIE